MELDQVQSNKKCLWNIKTLGTQMKKFCESVNEKFNLNLTNYQDLYEWSVDNYQDFWEQMWMYMGVICSKPYNEVMVRKGEGLLQVEWFSGALFNFAENLLSVRDDSIALICVDEDGVEEFVTYAQMYEEVKVYAAALRKHGLKKGDTVACYMSNRKEAVFAMLASASIGALWGGPLPYYGGKAALKMVIQMAPKFLFACDRYKLHGTEYDMLENVSTIANNCHSLAKTVIVKTRSCIPNISSINNSCFLEEFLEIGKQTEENNGEIDFEQLPPNQPLFVIFTSGSTGAPKGIVHSAVTALLLINRDSRLHFNIKSGDVLLCTRPVGWAVWNNSITYLSVGATILLYDGSPCYLSKSSYWDLVSKYKISIVFLATATVDKMEKDGYTSTTNCNLEHLKFVCIGASPVKSHNIAFLQQNIPSNVVIVNAYACTELLGRCFGSDFNELLYGGQIHMTSLGLSMKSFDSKGNSIVGSRGECVVTKPYIGFPSQILGDDKNEMLNSLYLSKYPGVWTLNDIVSVDPETMGYIFVGRSDEIMDPKGYLFSSSDIYNAICEMEELSDYLCVSQINALANDERAVLFVKTTNDFQLDESLIQKIKYQVKSELTFGHVPALVLEVPDIPYNLNHKRMEKVVRTIIQTNEVPEIFNIRNPECLSSFCNRPELQNY